MLTIVAYDIAEPKRLPKIAAHIVERHSRKGARLFRVPCSVFRFG